MVIMRATFEAGLSGTGPMPIHLHRGRPTPWTEGIVVRVEPDEAEAWIANAQGGNSYTTKIVEWDRAHFLIVIVQGARYLIRPDAPSEWQFVESPVTGCLLTPDQNLALVATYADVVALSREGKVMWRRAVGIDGVEIRQLTDDVVEGIACIDPPDAWAPFRIRTVDGTDA